MGSRRRRATDPRRADERRADAHLGSAAAQVPAQRFVHRASHSHRHGLQSRPPRGGETNRLRRGPVMTAELVDRRVLGAVRFLDATTLTAVTSGLRVESGDAMLRPNRSGLWVIWNAKG